uniref:Oxidoreductase n=1 Tax=Ditylum brightwellii TaxID=49249 RepID=A0A7S4R0B5_9STRA
MQLPPWMIPKKKKRSKNNDNSQNDDATTSPPANGLELYKQSNLRNFRKSLSLCLTLHQKTMFNGQTEDNHYDKRIQQRTLKRQKIAEASQQKKYIAATKLRRGRVEKLEKLKGDAMDEEEEKLRIMGMLVPDGHVDTEDVGGDVKMLENAAAAEEEEDGGGDSSTKEVTATDNSNNKDEEEEEINLPKLRSCYVCKIRYRKLHHFYDQLCPNCATLNYTKRHQSANLTNKIAVVTGSRVKIGFRTCLKLLRAGATVIATTRFPNSAALAYRKEEDFNVWKDRLHIFGLDLRDVTGLEAFTRFLKMKYGDVGIDILINNACQTIRRPRGYYIPMVEKEKELWCKRDGVHVNLLGGCGEFEKVRRKLWMEHSDGSGGKQRALEGENGSASTPLLQMGMDHASTSNNISVEEVLEGKDDDALEAGATKASSDTTTLTTTNESGKKNDNDQSLTTTEPSSASSFESIGLTHSAAMSQMVIVPEDVGVDPSILPPGTSDINGQQLDLRKTNSWLLKMDEVSTPEVMECMFINAIAPFVLNSRLKPLMMTTPSSEQQRPDRYVINVSAMEGKFYRYKMPNHPHTNMAKAALNMLTRTSSEDLAKNCRIFMNSVDTGWINDENPLDKASSIAKTNLFQTPIDEIDAAARILDLVFVGVNADHSVKEESAGGDGSTERKKDYGKFFKDYKESEW